MEPFEPVVVTVTVRFSPTRTELAPAKAAQVKVLVQVIVSVLFELISTTVFMHSLFPARQAVSPALRVEHPTKDKEIIAVRIKVRTTRCALIIDAPQR
jgi:hypothetical protein